MIIKKSTISERRLKEILKPQIMARKIIKDFLADHTSVSLLEADGLADKFADGLLARLAANDPPLLICTADEIKD